MSIKEVKIWMWGCDRCNVTAMTRSVYPEYPKGWKEKRRPDSANLMNHYCKKCSKEMTNDKPVIDERQHRFFQAAMQRPTDFNKLSAETQWSIDKSLGCLDWDGGCGHAVPGQKALNRVLCEDCQKAFNKKFYKRKKKRA